MLDTSLPPARTRLAMGTMLALCATFAHAQDTQPAAPTHAATPATPAEPARITLNEYIVRGNSVLDARAIEQAVTPHLGPGRTMDDIEAARTALQAAYQARGYQSVHVDLPDQQVSGGIVLLQVNEARIGNVSVAGARHNDPQRLLDRVPALAVGAVPDFNQAQAQLTALNQTAKRQVVPLVKPGADASSMDVELKVDDASPWRFSASLNNDHSADTTALRGIVSVGNDNLWQREHSATLTLFAAPEDMDEAKVWSGSYTMPLGRSGWLFELNGLSSDSNVLTAGNTNVTGRGDAVGARLLRTLPMTGAWWHQFSAGVTFNDREEQVGMLEQSVQYVPLKYAPITLAYSGFRQGDKHLLTTGMQLVFGTRSLLGYGGDAAEFDWARYRADPSFVLLKGEFGDTYTFEGGQQLAARVSAQMTDTPLVSGEQFAAGGLYTVRGYRSAEAIGDYGALASLEWRTQPFGLLGLQDWRVYAYLDAAWMALRDPLPEQADEFSLGAAGLGTSFRLTDYLNVRLDYGYPLLDGPTTTKGAHRLHFSIGTSF